MFKLTKKKKLQENENVEKNDNISVSTDSIFPTAKSTLEITLKKWKDITAKEIIEEIQYRSNRGFRYADFYHTNISDELVDELRTQGYRVEVSRDSEIVPPSFKIYW